jgi:hypothetical protein
MRAWAGKFPPLSVSVTLYSSRPVNSSAGVIERKQKQKEKEWGRLPRSVFPRGLLFNFLFNISVPALFLHSN